MRGDDPHDPMNYRPDRDLYRRDPQDERWTKEVSWVIPVVVISAAITALVMIVTLLR